VAVHFGGGLWGLIAASFVDNSGLVFGATHESAMVSSLNVPAHFLHESLLKL
jgi:hypothetical protein